MTVPQYVIERDNWLRSFDDAYYRLINRLNSVRHRLAFLPATRVLTFCRNRLEKESLCHGCC